LTTIGTITSKMTEINAKADDVVVTTKRKKERRRKKKE
jgi:hypothetical protein